MASDDLLARIKAAERAELERFDQKYIEEEKRMCHGCLSTWRFADVSRKYRFKPTPPIWIEAAQEYWHLRCWQDYQERGKK